jgi:hypothetical protein
VRVHEALADVTGIGLDAVESHGFAIEISTTKRQL